jgi:protein-S-isoprenylcysteine O-methyltransferase Ste14
MVRRTVLVAIVVYALQYILFPNLHIPTSQRLAFILGLAWVVSGFLIYIPGGREINRNFNKGELATSGIFKYIQHPIYSAFCLFLIPGIVLMTRSLIGFALPFVFYFFFRRYIPYEEEYLEERFGKRYLEYKKRTGRIFPKW